MSLELIQKRTRLINRKKKIESELTDIEEAIEESKIVEATNEIKKQLDVSLLQSITWSVEFGDSFGWSYKGPLLRPLNDRQEEFIQFELLIKEYFKCGIPYYEVIKGLNVLKSRYGDIFIQFDSFKELFKIACDHSLKIDIGRYLYYYREATVCARNYQRKSNMYLEGLKELNVSDSLIKRLPEWSSDEFRDNLFQYGYGKVYLNDPSSD